MIIIRRVFIVQLLAAAAFLSIGFILADQGLAAIAFVLLGLLWFFAEERGVRGMESFVLFLYVFAAAVGFLQGVSGWMLLLATVTALGAWDLTPFLQRLRSAARVDYETGLGREHLRRLALIEGAGLLAGMLALTARTQISFWWEAFLALLVVIGISQLVAYMRKQAEE